MAASLGGGHYFDSRNSIRFRQDRSVVKARERLVIWAMFWSRAAATKTLAQITALTCLDHAGDLVEIEWNFWNQNNVRPPSDAAMQRDPAGMASHYFDHHDSPVAGRRCMHPIECVHYAATAESNPNVVAVASRSFVDVLGTPMQLMPASCNCCAVTIEPSPRQ